MPLGVLTEEQAVNELNRFGLISNSIQIEHKEIERGRGNTEEIPVSVRSFIATESLSGAPAKQIAELYDVSPSSISAYKNGATSTASYHNGNPEILNSINAMRDRIIGPAQSRIIKAISSISDEKLDNSKARDAAGIAAQLSSVIKNLSPESEANKNTQITIFAPRKNEEEDYEIIKVDV